MEVKGVIKVIGETEVIGAKGFRKRLLVVTTDEQYPQMIPMEFVQDKVDLLDAFSEDDNVIVHTNLRGREWINPEGEARYFLTLQGWRISKEGASETPTGPVESGETKDDLPF